MQTVVTAKRLWDGDRQLDEPLIAIEDGRIVSITRRADARPGDYSTVFDFPGATLAPAFFDAHIHGAAGHDVMEATPEALAAICSLLAAHGTCGFLATTITAPLNQTLRAVSGLARIIREPGLVQGRNLNGEPLAMPLGIHLEGPFLSHARRGVHPAEHLMAPDLAVFDHLFEAAEGQIRVLTLAPELPGAAELAAHATARGVRVSVGHSNATAAETRSVMAAGAVSATHTFNAMRPLDHREPGILGVVLTADSIFSELICDGIHTAPETVELWWRAKGPELTILVTDAMSATGMPDGEYRLGGMAVQVSGGKAMVNGVLAGSVLTLDNALKNFIAFTGAPLEQALRLTTRNPAAMTGLSDKTGSLAEGQPANLIAVDETGKLVASLVGGRLVPVR